MEKLQRHKDALESGSGAGVNVVFPLLVEKRNFVDDYYP
jgi:hypothetical protein